MKDDVKIFVFMVLIIGIATGGYFWGRKDKEVKKFEDVDGGVVKDQILKGYNETINSKDIVNFKYNNSDFVLECELKEDGLHVISRGGYSYQRDGSYFKLGYNAKDNSLLNELQDIIDKYGITKNNGYVHETAGLPAGLGDNISVLYSSGEKIWKYSNQSPTISDDAVDAIYNAFKKCAQENGYDFTSNGSNEVLYDDADVNYLQGTWKGIHFGKEYVFKFYSDYVKIYEDGKLTDDTKYIIIEGKIVSNKLKNGIDSSNNYHDYEEFSNISTMSKKNDFTLTAYFMKDSYSTCDLIKQR